MWKPALFYNFHGLVGPRGCIKSKSCITPNVNDLWSPTSLVLCTTPNSKVLFSELGNVHLFVDFDEP